MDVMREALSGGPQVGVWPFIEKEMRRIVMAAGGTACQKDYSPF